jgi:glycosyltransferase involved in cell wall biosynthesis
MRNVGDGGDDIAALSQQHARFFKHAERFTQTPQQASTHDRIKARHIGEQFAEGTLLEPFIPYIGDLAVATRQQLGEILARTIEIEHPLMLADQCRHGGESVTFINTLLSDGFIDMRRRLQLIHKSPERAPTHIDESHNTVHVPTMLFIRRYHETVGHNGFLGGHLKFFHYAAHVVSTRLFEARLYVTPENAVLDEAFITPGLHRTKNLKEADAYFVAGLDWLVLDRAGINTAQRPVINLIQGFAHLTPGDPRRNFLSRPALRICVSTALRDALAATGLVNGPLTAIENGIDIQVDSAPKREPHTIFIAGLKNPPLAQEVAAMLARGGISTSLQTRSLPRQAFLESFREAGIAVLLPFPHEGFFLPALEAMALGCAVVIPQCDGTSSFCRPEHSALVTDYTAETIVNAVLRLHANPMLAQSLRRNGLHIAEQHSLERERALFLPALHSYLRQR